MRPRNNALRQLYVDTASELRALKKPVTPRTLSRHLPKSYHAVRTFLNRNPELAAGINLQRQGYHTEDEYLAAVKGLLEGGAKITGRTIGANMGLNHSSVYRFLCSHPNVRRKIREIAEQLSVPNTLKADPTWLTEIKRSGEMTVQHFDSHVRRVVLNKVDLTEYVRLWDKGYLRFQLEGLPRPDYLPSREGAVEFI